MQKTLLLYNGNRSNIEGKCQLRSPHFPFLVVISFITLYEIPIHFICPS